MKKLLFVCMLFSSVIYTQNLKMTLNECLQLAFENSKEIKISESNINSASAKVNEVKAGLFPKLSAGANLIYTSKAPIEFNLPTLPGMVPQTTDDESIKAAILNVSIDQPVFTGFKLWSLKNSAKYQLKSQQEQHKLALNNTAISIYNLYWNIYKIEKNIEVVSETLLSVENTEREILSFIENGMALKADLLNLQNKKAQLKIKKMDLQNKLELAMINLKQSLGMGLDATLSLNPSPEELNLSLHKDDQLIQTASEQRPEIKSVDYSILAGKEFKKSAQSDYWPQLFLSAGVYHISLDSEAMPVSTNPKNFFNVGLNLKWNIWDWSKTSSKVEQAEQQIIRTELKRKQLEELILVEVTKNYLELKNLKEKISAVEISIEAANENLNIIKNMFKNQMATATQLFEAENNLLAVRTDYMNLIADFQIVKALYEKSLGQELY